MSFRTPITERFNLSCPVIQAPIAGGSDTAKLVSAVSNTGGLGFISASYLTPDEIIHRGHDIKAQTSRLYGINLFAPLPPPKLATEAYSKALQRISLYLKELGLPSPSAPTPPVTSFDELFEASMKIGPAAFSVAFGLAPASAIETAKRGGIYEGD